MCESLALALGLVFLIIRPFFVQSFYIPSASMHPTLIESDHIMVNKLIYRFSEPKYKDVVVFRAPFEATGGDPAKRDFIKRVIGVPGDIIRVTAPVILINDIQYTAEDMRESIRTFKGLDKKARVKFTKDGAIVVGSKMSLSDIAQIKNSGPKAKVKIVPGTVYINEKPLVEPYTLEDPNDSYPELYKINPNDSGNIVTLHGLQSMKIPKGKLLVMGDNRNDSFDARFWGLLDRSRMQGKAMFIFWPIPRVRWVH
jgi:signal peptidase I